MRKFDTLYKRTSAGAVQIWYQEVEGDSYRTVSGQYDGKHVTSEWHKCEPKNPGKKNATTAEEQCVLEVQANYTKRLKSNYHRKIEDIDIPQFFKPMLAKDFDDYAHKIKFVEVFAQPKLDGMRCIVTAEGMFSRTGERIVSAPHVWEAIENTGFWDTHPNGIVDGELYNHQLKDDFDKIMSLARKTKDITEEELKESEEKLQYHIYDCSFHDDRAFFDRFAVVCNHFDSAYTVCLQIVPTRPVTDHTMLDALYEQWLTDGYEGQMVRLNGPYVNKRTSDLLKRKEMVDNEYPLVDLEEGVGTLSGMAGRAICRLPDGRTFAAGVMGGHSKARELLRDKEKYIGGDVTVQHFKQLTPAGIPRFPKAKFFWGGKRNA